MKVLQALVKDDLLESPLLPENVAVIMEGGEVKSIFTFDDEEQD